MRLLVQRVSRAEVRVGGGVVGAVGRGLCVLVGFGPGDDAGLPGSRLWDKAIEKLLDLRIFPDADGKLNVGLREYGGGLLVVSQFTLYADLKKGRRPSFHLAAAPDVAEALYGALVADLSGRMPGLVAAGVFGAEMEVELINWGPVTIMLDTAGL